MLRYQKRIREKTLGPDISQLTKMKRAMKKRAVLDNKDLDEMKKILQDPDFFDKLFNAFSEESIKIQPLAVSMDKRKKTSFCKKIKLTDDGELIGEWPDGFFDERFDEIGI